MSTQLMTIEGDSSTLLGEARSFLRENPEVMGFIGTSALMAIAARRLARRAGKRVLRRIGRRIIMNRAKKRFIPRQY